MNIMNSKFKAVLIAIMALGLVFNWVSLALAINPLIISNVVISPSDTTALITWHTNEASTGRIDFGLTVDYGLFISEGTVAGTEHAITLYGLASDKTYHLKISAASKTQETKTFDFSFKTKKFDDTRAPIIKNVEVAYVTGTSATVQWETSEKASSRVDFGLTEKYGSSASGSSGTVHDVTIRGLKTSTTYHFLVKSADDAGNLTRYYDLTFRTQDSDRADKAALEISNITPTSVNDPQIKSNTVSISWRTNKLASGLVYFGETTSVSKRITVAGARDFFHETTLTNLSPETTYYFKVESVDVFGKTARSDLYSFITKNPEDFKAEEATGSTGFDGGDISNLPLDNLGPIFYASFDQSLAPDIAGGSYSYSKTGAVVLTDGKFGQAAEIFPASELEYSGANNFNIAEGTIAFWFKPNWNADDKKNHILFDLNPDYTSASESYFSIAKSTQFGVNQALQHKLALAVEDKSDSDFNCYDKSGQEIKAGEWYFAAGSWKFGGGELKFYFNSETPSCVIKNLGAATDLGAKIFVGSKRFAGTDAAIDEFLIFNRVLTDDEIKVIYNEGGQGFIDGGVGGPDDGIVAGGDGNGDIGGANVLKYTKATALLRIKGSPDIYAIMDGKRHYISGPNSFAKYGYNFGDVKDVSREELEKYPVARLLKTPDSPTVFYIFERPQDKWLKIAIPSATVFISYPENFWGDIITVTEEDIRAYPDAQLIKTADSAQVYLLAGDTARPFASDEAFEALGYNWAEICEITEEHLGAYVIGSVISNQ